MVINSVALASITVPKPIGRFIIPVKILLFVTFLIFNNFIGFAQKPYFQQRCEYEINVQLNDKINFLNGNVSIKYTNNSTDTLSFIYMHLWPNAYKDRNTALSKQLLENGRKSLYFASNEDRGYIDSLNFKIDGIPVVPEYDILNPDICKITPKNPVKPGETIEIATPFRVKIPSGKFSRFGHIGESYFITQWFPKPAVYDLSGWNQMPYLDQGEFYSEFGSFSVTITLPENYVVGATGRLQNESEIKWINDKVQQTEGITNFGNDNSFPPSSDKLKTITFKQDSIHDFAWFADKRFHILKGSVELPTSKRTVETWAYFTNAEPNLWKKGISYINNAISFYSNQVGDYPYSQYIGIDGTVTAGGGMEYPMITVINTSDDPFTLDDVLAHEIGHSWFYGVLGFNERTHGWMDEGINSFYELGYIEQQYPGKEGSGKNDFSNYGKFGKAVGTNEMTMREGFDIAYKMTTWNNSDQPATTTSVDFTDLNYGAVMYRKTALAFTFLEAYLGKDLFRNCMKSFYEEWKFKHPSPDDLRNVLELKSGKNLDWFFDDVLGSITPIRYKIKKAECTGDSCSLLILNKDGVAAPFFVSSNDSTQTWFEGFVGKKKNSFAANPDNGLRINDGFTTLFKSSPKKYVPGAFLNYGKKIKLKTIPQFSDKAGIQYLYLVPVAAWNRYNQFMAGCYFSNVDFVPQPFEFNLTPLYDFKNKQLAGMASFNYHIWPLDGTLSGITFSLKGKRFAYSNLYSPGNIDKVTGVYNYSKIDPAITFNFRKKTPRSTLSQAIAFRSINIWQEEKTYVKVDSSYKGINVTTFLNFNELTYSLINSRTLDPYFANIKLEQGESYLKLYGELNYHFSYAKSHKGVDVRLFAGGFITNTTTDRNYNFRMSGWEGYRDYKYDEIYFGRSDNHGFWDNQFMIKDGGFKIPTFVGQSNKWIAAINISVDLPLPLPISFFTDIGTYEGINSVFPDLNNRVMYDGGLSLKLFKQVLEIYVPLFNSEDIQKSLEVNDIKFFDKVRFVFNINNLSPLKLRNSILQSFQ